MKKTFLKSALIVCAVLQLSVASAQLQLPQPSPRASVMQTVGLTEITVDYSSPAVKGRTIWGELVPYDKVWRAGANAPTKITFSKDVVIEGVNVPKGSYSFFVIPSKAEWTLILNKDLTASADQYKQENDVVRVKTAPVAINEREHLAYMITDFNDDVASIAMEWEKARVAFKVSCGTAKQAVENIDKTIGSTWMLYNNAARYYYDKKDYDKALSYVNQSISLSDQWFNNWVKAQIMAAKSQPADAYKYAVKAQEMGNKNPEGFFFKEQVDKAVAEWKPAETTKKKK